MRFEKQVFTTDVTLDHNEFIDCEFRDCTMQYFGGDFSLVRARLTNVRFELGDSAYRTIQFLKVVQAALGEDAVAKLLSANELSQEKPALLN